MQPVQLSSYSMHFRWRSHVSRELIRVDNWLKAKKLILNVSKIIYIHTHSTTLQFEIQSVRKFQQSNFLALHLMKISLLMTMHVNKVKRMYLISKSVGVMRRLFCHLPADVMSNLVCSPESNLCFTGMGKIGTYECCFD